jgi:ATP-binding cassette subfamily B protein
VLHGVDLSVRPGESVAIVGRTGSGKTTLLHLIARLYEPTEGTIALGGVPAERWPRGLFRRRFGNVPQETFLFSDTIRANIAFGFDDDGADPRAGAAGTGAAGVAAPIAPARDAGLERAAQRAGLGPDLAGFPAGLETILGERGVTLSGGQKQRVALARAAVREPAILLLDDALSSVDAHTEREVLASLRHFMKDRTSVLITHRMAVALDAERVIVLDAGRVLEQGAPADLLARRGAFAAMVERQKLADALDSDGTGR